MKIPSMAIAGTTLISALFFIQCNKQTVSPDNSYGLPNATQTGATTFGSVLTGIGSYNNPVTIFFIADNDLNDPFYSSSANGVWLNGDTLTIGGTPQKGSYFQGIKFTIIGNLQQGAIYNVDSAGVNALSGSDSTCMGVSGNVTSSISDSGTVQLTKFDTVNKIISGIFTCNFPYPGCDSTVYATQGRFDYKYH